MLVNLVNLVALVVIVLVVDDDGGGDFHLGDAWSLFPNSSGKELEQESTRFSELDTRCEQLEAAGCSG